MDYVLMNKNTPVLRLTMDEGYILSVEEIYSADHLPVEVLPKKEFIKSTLRKWWESRSIPASRDQINDGLFNLGIQANVVPAFLLEKCFGLSLSDQYWINPVNSPLKWSDINFFENEFSEDIGKALFDNQAVDHADFMSPDNTSDGCLKKKWKIIDGERCLIKAGSRPYFQQPFNEVIASAVCKRLGIQSYVDYRLDFENGEPVSVCNNFITPDTELVSAHSLMAREQKSNHLSYYQFYIDLCQNVGIDNICDSLDEMFVLDFIIRNEDRHTRNFGLIRNVETLNYIGAAPLFDNGTSLLFDIATEDIVHHCISKNSPSKPFKNTQDKQIELVKSPDRFDLTKLKDIDEEVYSILKKGNFLSETRVSALCKAISARIRKLDRIFSDRSIRISVSETQPKGKPSVLAEIQEIQKEQQNHRAEEDHIKSIGRKKTTELGD